MTILGVDPSSKGLHVVVGFQELDPEFFVRKELKFNESGPYTPLRAQRAYDLFQEFLARCYEEMPDSKNEFEVFLEGPVVGKGGVKSTMVQAYVSGAVQAACSGFGEIIHLVNVTSWKKEIVGNGRAGKSEVKRAMRGRGIPDGLQQDFYDATAICLYGLDATRRAKALGVGGQLS